MITRDDYIPHTADCGVQCRQTAKVNEQALPFEEATCFNVLIYLELLLTFGYSWLNMWWICCTFIDVPVKESGYSVRMLDKNSGSAFRIPAARTTEPGTFCVTQLYCSTTTYLTTH